MPILSDSVLIESRTARDDQLGNMPHQKAQSIIEKVKGLYFALWKGVGIATTEAMADFYSVPEVNIRQLLKNHREEFDSDGLKTLRGKALKDVSYPLSLSSTPPHLTIWTPRSALRLGMLIKGSVVAKAVRTALLDTVEHVAPAQAEEIERLRLQLALLQTQERLMSASQLLGSINPDLPVLILRPDVKVIERPVSVETTVLVDEHNRA